MEEIKENTNIKTDYVITNENDFIKYTNQFSSNKGIKLEEQMLIFVIEPTNDNINNLIFINSMMNIPMKTIDINIIFLFYYDIQFQH